MLSLGSIAAKIFGTSNERRVRVFRSKVDAINALEPEIAALSDAELRARTETFRQQLQSGADLDDLLVPAFATVREAAKRTLGQRHFDVQLVGGMVLHRGDIAEMKTGEGKTLVATLPVYLNALKGRGVHVVTVNDYLARRDAEWMGQVYKFLGLTVGCIVHDLDDEQRKAQYACDVTYGTNNELGFDYLRDNMKMSASDMVQRGHAYAIVDEVDLDPDRRGADAPHHLRTHRGPRRPLCRRRCAHPAAQARGLRARREAAAGLAHRGRQRAHRAAPGGRRAARGRIALRHRERDGRPPRQPGAEGAQAVPARQGLHRQRRAGRHHRRVHRPHDAGPALLGGPAPGARGQGARRDPAREPDARLDHVPELLPALRKTRRHDRHRLDRGQRVHGHLRARGARDPDQRDGRARGRGRRDLPHAGREVRGHRDDDRGLPPPRPADARRHDLDREVRTALGTLEGPRLHRRARPQDDGRGGQAEGRQGGRAQGLPRRYRRLPDRDRCQEGQQHRPDPAPGAERALPRAGSPHHRAGGRTRRGNDRDQHGRPRHRHPARRQRRVPAEGLDRRGKPPPGARPRRPRSPSAVRRSTPTSPRRRRRRWTRAASTSSAPSATRAAASTTSSAAVRGARATPAAPSSTSRSTTT